MNIKEALEKTHRRIKYTNLEGENREVLFVLLKRKKAFKIYNTTLRLVAETLASAGIALQSGNAAKAASALSNLDDDVIWSLAESLLTGATLYRGPDDTDIIETISSIEDTEIFDDNWNELYMLIYQGVQANYPKCIAQLKAKMGGFGGQLGQAAAILNGSKTPSTAE